jgi:hypothetical protein
VPAVASSRTGLTTPASAVGVSSNVRRLKTHFTPTYGFIMQKLIVATFIFLAPATHAQDERIASGAKVYSESPHVRVIFESMKQSLAKSRELRTANTGEFTEFEMLVDGRDLEESNGTFGSILVIWTIPCVQGHYIYVGHQQGLCGGAGLRGCGESLAQATEHHARKAKQILAKNQACRSERR